MNMRWLQLLIVIASAGALLPAYGQGVVTFWTGSVSISTNSVHGGPATGLTWASSTHPNSFYYGLLVAPTTQMTVDSSFADWTFTGNYATNTRAGQFWGNYTTDPGVIIPGYPIGTFANFVVIGWSADLGHDWSEVAPMIQDGSASRLGFLGISPVGVNVFVSGDVLPIPVIMGTGTYQIPAFTLDAPIPEPSGFWLAALGAGILWHGRRKSAWVRARALLGRSAKT